MRVDGQVPSIERGMSPLAVSAFSLVSCLGAGYQRTAVALRRGEIQLYPCDLDGATLRTHIGRVRGVEAEPITGRLAAYDCRNNRLAQMALDQDGFLHAVAQARERYGAHRIGLFAGTSTGGLIETERAYRERNALTGALPTAFRFREAYSISSVGEYLQQVLGLNGPALVVSAACASAAKTFAVAARMISVGLCDAAVVGGADSLCLTTLYGFHSLQLTSETACRPYDTARSGISIGEAAGFVLLERAELVPNGMGVLLTGTGESSDAYHMSSPDPQGRGSSLAMLRALEAAQVLPAELDYINLHGTATRMGDAAEATAIRELFGTAIPCNSTKGQTGHALGSAGIVEAAISIICILEDLLPGSPSTTQVDPALQCGYTVKGAMRRMNRIMSNSFGFGGSNCSLVFARA